MTTKIKFDVYAPDWSLVGRKAQSGVQRAIKLAALGAQSDAKRRIMASPATGIKYRVGVNRFHVSSSAGNAPRSNTGMLLASIKAHAKAQGFEVFSTDYGNYLENGTRHIAPRPWARPAIESQMTGLQNAINQVLNNL
jgi:hypothetical protein